MGPIEALLGFSFAAYRFLKLRGGAEKDVFLVFGFTFALVGFTKGRRKSFFQNKRKRKEFFRKSSIFTKEKGYNWRGIVNFLETGIAKIVNLRYNYGHVANGIVAVVPIHPKGALL